MNILFLGEKIGGLAEYYIDCILKLGHAMTHVGSDEELIDLKEDYNVVIISDYPSKRINDKHSKCIIKMVQNGARFIMIGGWDSFNGKGISYYGHPLAECLPVILSPKDDRNNITQGLILYPDPGLHTKLPIDWLNPPVICGYNAVLPKDDARVLIWIKPIQTDGHNIQFKKSIPLVIKNYSGKGTSIACLTDLVPHWCGGLVDWGNKRLSLEHVEIGDMYLLFLRFLLEI